MNKAELIQSIVDKTDMKKKEVEKLAAALFQSIEEELVKGEKVQLVGFGTFEVRERAGRTGRNPRTGEELVIAPAKVPAFKPGKALKDAVNVKEEKGKKKKK